MIINKCLVSLLLSPEDQCRPKAKQMVTVCKAMASPSEQKRWEKSFVINFAKAPINPKDKEIENMVIGMLKAKPSFELVRLHLNAITLTAHVQMATREQAIEMLELNRSKHGVTIDGVFYEYEMEMDDGATDVRILDLPYFIGDEILADEMSKYGEVIDIQELRHAAGTALAGVLMGIRVVWMIRKAHIRSFVEIGGETTRVRYPGQHSTCR